MSPVPFPLAASLLRPLASWCLDTFEGLDPLLVGVDFRDDTVGLHPIHLDQIDPLHDITSLRAPDDWDAAVLLVDVIHASVAVRNWISMTGIIAVAADRTGQTAAQLDLGTGSRTPIDRGLGPLARVCTEFLEPCKAHGRRWSAEH